MCHEGSMGEGRGGDRGLAKHFGLPPRCCRASPVSFLPQVSEGQPAAAETRIPMRRYPVRCCFVPSLLRPRRMHNRPSDYLPIPMPDGSSVSVPWCLSALSGRRR